MKSITLPQLELVISKMFADKGLYYVGTFDYLKDLYHTGCRPVELLRKESLQLIGDTLHVTTAKTGAIRTFPIYMLSPAMYECVYNNNLPYYGLTYDQLLYDFQRVWPMPKLYTENKEVGLYVFRYAKARRMYHSGYAKSDIIKEFQWQNPNHAELYIHRPLQFEGQYLF